ncbi:MAG: hypothetical protein K2X93_04295 [Candidatus Obscuribacterales bacterium]|nr:hypothetical protein [Candidatus Obscuribacterales bacterium]
MRTICPYPDCLFEFDLPGDNLDKRGHDVGVCPHCNRAASFRSMDAAAIIEREHDKRVRKDALSGGPERSPEFKPKLSVLVEDVRSLWNVGSIFRTSDGAQFEHIYLTGITGSPPRKEIEKVSLGAENHVSWQYDVNPLTVLEKLKSTRVQIVGLEKNDTSVLLGEDLASRKLDTPMCLVVGNEVSGLSPQVLNFCDLVCHLPMKGMKESLNVAVAYGIAAYMISEKLLPVG